MDIISTIYKELFQIKLVHKAFNNANGTQLFQQVTAVPDNETQQLFSRLSIGYKCVNDTIICFIQSQLVAPPAKEPKTPFVNIAGDVKFRFLLTASSGFFNKTYVATTGSKVVYYFTNKINHVESAKTYISKTIDPYSIAKSYDAGIIVSSGGEPYATIQPVNSADAIPLSNANFWKKILPLEPMVNNADLADTAIVKPATNCFAVIDVFNNGTTNASYNLFGGAKEILSPVYVLPFKSKI